MKEQEGSRILYRENGRKGSEIKSAEYERLCSFILSTLKKQKTITILELLDLSFEQFYTEDRNTLSRMLLQVKQDMEVRGIIVVAFGVACTQHIALAGKRHVLNYRHKRRYPRRMN